MMTKLENFKNAFERWDKNVKKRDEVWVRSCKLRTTRPSEILMKKIKKKCV
jgi:hypothetical protein